MGGLDTYLTCWACRNFSGDDLKTTGRACSLHDFVLPRAGHSFVCKDLDSNYPNNPELPQLETTESGKLLYNAFPYYKGIHSLAPFSSIQRRIFGVTFSLGRHYDMQHTFPEYVFPLGMAQSLWKTFVPGETIIVVEGRRYTASVALTMDLRNNDTQPVLHSAAAMPELLEYIGFNTTMARMKNANWPIRGYEAFVECADDQSEFRFIRDEVWAHMPDNMNLPISR